MTGELYILYRVDRQVWRKFYIADIPFMPKFLVNWMLVIRLMGPKQIHTKL